MDIIAYAMAMVTKINSNLEHIQQIQCRGTSIVTISSNPDIILINVEMKLVWRSIQRIMCESKKKEIMVWRQKEVNNESNPGVPESDAGTSSFGN